MRAWDAPKMTASERAMYQKMADDAGAVRTLLYSLLKFSVEIEIQPDGMKGLQEAIKSIDSFRSAVISDLRRDLDPKAC